MCYFFMEIHFPLSYHSVVMIVRILQARKIRLELEKLFHWTKDGG